MQKKRITVLRRIVRECAYHKVFVHQDYKAFHCLCIKAIGDFEPEEKYLCEILTDNQLRVFPDFYSDEEESSPIFPKNWFDQYFFLDEEETPICWIVDLTTANMLCQIYGAFQTEKNRETFETIHLGQLIEFGWSQVRREA